MEATITIVSIIAIGGITVRLLKRKRDGDLPVEDYGFSMPEVGAGVWSFGAHTRDDAEASAREFVKRMESE